MGPHCSRAVGHSFVAVAAYDSGVFDMSNQTFVVVVGAGVILAAERIDLVLSFSLILSHTCWRCHFSEKVTLRMSRLQR